MPLLRRKPFAPEPPPEDLTADEEVFFCEMTGEVFRDYELFYQRMILCNSLVWTCECTGRASLTYKEAIESEENARKATKSVSTTLQAAILLLVHHTRRSKLQGIAEEVYYFLKHRYQPGEIVEVKVSDGWNMGHIVQCPDEINVRLISKKLNKSSSNDSFRKRSDTDKENNGSLEDIGTSSPIDECDKLPDPSCSLYKVEIKQGAERGNQVIVKGKWIRRMKNVFSKDKTKLFIKQTCVRSTASSDDGYWIVKKNEISKHCLGMSSVSGVTSLKSPNRRKSHCSAESKSPCAAAGKKGKQQRIKRKKKEKARGRKTKENGKDKQIHEQARELTLDEKATLKQLKKVEKEVEKRKKFMEKEVEKARKRDAQKKEKEFANEMKKVETDFLREWYKLREDLSLENLQPLPTLKPMKSKLDQWQIGDAIMVVEFVNTFGVLFQLEQEIGEKITYEWVEEALLQHDAEGKFYEITKFLLHTYLRQKQDENSREDDQEASSSGDSTPADSSQQDISEDSNYLRKQASLSSRAAAAWPMLHQGMSLSEISIEPYSLSEVLRLHILSSGVKIGGIRNLSDWHRKGAADYCDDPCVEFRHREAGIMTALMTNCVYDLQVSEKLKLLVLLCNQLLMLQYVRESIEDAFDKAKELKKQLRELQHEENKRRKALAAEKLSLRKKEREDRKKEVEERKKAKPSRELENVNIVKAESAQSTAYEHGDSKDGEQKVQERKEETRRRRDEKDEEQERLRCSKFQEKERVLMDELASVYAMVSGVPLGRDRIFRRYWCFTAVNGLLVENDDEGALRITELSDTEYDECEADVTETEADVSADEGDRLVKEIKKEQLFPKIPLDELFKARSNGSPIVKPLFQRYKCELPTRCADLVQKSESLSAIVKSVETAVDPVSYSVRDSTKWYEVDSIEQFSSLIDNLNTRGIREQKLKENLQRDSSKLADICCRSRDVFSKSRSTKQNPKRDSSVIDKTLFKTMDDYLEADLRDNLLEFEGRLYLAGLGSVKSADREAWRKDIEDGMARLINYAANGECKPLQPNSESRPVMNGDLHGVEEHMDVDASLVPFKSIPMHIKEEKMDDRGSRCSTPTAVSEPMIYPAVRCLAQALLEIEQGIERKYLKPPLGETEETKRERIKELIDAAASQFDGSVDEGMASLAEEENKKPSTCLSRWEESLVKCTSYSQIFIHLLTLDRSVMWDKSVQNMRCRTCRRKGDEEQMLICDGCDRGFHMYCLKPPLKKVPQGDWFCRDCKPVELRTPSKRRPSTAEEEEEEEGEETEYSEDSEDSEEDEESDDDEDEIGVEEDESDFSDGAASEDGSQGSVHADTCTVCANDGVLILCEECPRAYHVECVYPPIRKVPRGHWVCQVCTGADLQLPINKRASTVEKKRGKPHQDESKSKKCPAKQARSSARSKGSKRPIVQLSPPECARPAKRARTEGSQESPHLGLQAFSRQQVKACNTLLNDVFKHADSEPFLQPVDTEEVKDYLKFIDRPMDFGTIRHDLNASRYGSVDQFLSDVRLVFTNCEIYNPARHAIAKKGAKLKDYVEKRLRDLDL